MSLHSEVLRICLSLESLVLPCFGPNGLDALLENSDGHDLCTNSGIRTLSFLSPTHPGGLLVTRAVKNLHAVTGDNSKKAVLMLTAALKEAILNFNKVTAFEVSMAFKHLNTEMEDMFEAHLGKNIKECSTSDLPQLRCECFRLLETCWGNCHSSSVVKVLKGIAVPLFFPDHVTTFPQLCKHLEYVRHKLPVLTQYATGLSAQTSLVAQGFVMERDFVYTPVDFCGLENFQFLVITSGIGACDSEEEVPTTLKVSSDVGLCTAIEYYPSQLQKLISKVVQSTGATLVLCGGRVTATAAQILTRMGVMAVQMVPEDLLYLIVESVGRTPAASLDAVTKADSVVGLRCDLLIVGHKRFVRLECLQPRDVAVSVVLCGPTVGCCRELGQSLLCGVKMATMWCKPVKSNGHVLSSLPGGGAWEVCLAKGLEKEMSSDANHIAKRAMQKGLLSIALGLYTNALPGKLSRKKMTDFYQATTSKEDTLVWIDPTTGCIEKPKLEQLPWEPFSTQLFLVQSVLNLLAQLLRMDSVVGVSRLPSVEGTGSDSDD